jgi:hypothetical protein
MDFVTREAENLGGGRQKGLSVGVRRADQRHQIQKWPPRVGFGPELLDEPIQNLVTKARCRQECAGISFAGGDDPASHDKDER